MRFTHASSLRAAFPDLSAAVLAVTGVTATVDAGPQVAAWLAQARARLADAPEGAFPEIQAWRRAFTQMGLKPTQYRCAAEALLRRVRQSGDLPCLLPLIDLCNALSAATALPIAVFDRAQIIGDLTVRFAEGTESYTDFSGALETPPVGEVIFADATGQAHARRWCHRQSRISALRADSRDALIVIEAQHPGGAADVAWAAAQLGSVLQRLWGQTAVVLPLTTEEPVALIDG